MVRAGNLMLTLNGTVSPKLLPRQAMAPVSVSVSGKIGTADGSQPLAAKEFIAEIDRNGAVDATGLPVCKTSQIEATTTASAEKACKRAIVGKGSTEVRVAFPESTPFTARGPLDLFNGGVKGGKTLVLIHAYVDVPAPTSIVSPVRITKEHRGPFGIKAVAKIPVIAGGSGSLTAFSFIIHRLFPYKGQERSYATAHCADGHFDAYGVAKFSGGVELAGPLQTPCRSKGG